MKRSLSMAIQITLLVPAMLCVPYILMLLPTILLDLASHVIGLIEAIFGLSVAVSILAGLVASWTVILSGANRVKGDKPLKIKVQVGLALGIFAGGSVLIWAVKFIVHEGSSHQGSAIFSWLLFLSPPIAEVTYQLVRLIMPVSPRDERSALPADKAT